MKPKNTRAEFMRLLEEYDKALSESAFSGSGSYRWRIKSAIKAGAFRNQLIDQFSHKK